MHVSRSAGPTSADDGPAAPDDSFEAFAAYPPRRVVLAYSGGLDTSVMLQWIRSTFRCDVDACIADVGQCEDLDAIAAKACRAGASTVRVVDLKEEFVRDFVFPAVRAGAVYEGRYLLGTSLARPPIAAAQLQMAQELGADTLAHGATGKGNDQVRFELTYYARSPHVRVLAPWRLWSMKSRQELLEYARQHGIEVESVAEKGYSCDRNLLHCSFEGGILEDPWAPPPADIFVMTEDPVDAPSTPQELTIGFEEGWPVTVDGSPLRPAALLGRLNEIGGAHGVGRVDIVENRFAGMKSRGVYETPGGTLLHTALRAVESITMDREVLRLRDAMAHRYAESVYYGFWFSPEMRVLQDMVDSAMQGVTGTARLRLYKGGHEVVGRTAPSTLYSAEHATFEADDVYRQEDAAGFIRLQALRLRIAAARDLCAPATGQPSAKVAGDSR